MAVENGSIERGEGGGEAQALKGSALETILEETKLHITLKALALMYAICTFCYPKVFSK